MKLRWETAVGALGFVLLVVGQYLGLFYTPADAHMGDVARILYVHVPAAWAALVTYTIAFGAAAWFLWSGKPGADAAVEASVEVGAVLNALFLVLGSLFARPTWGVWWDWDPRLTSSLVMLLTFIGVILLRSLIEDLDRKALWSAVATVVAYVNAPLVYFSVRWFRSLHQVQSSPETMQGQMVLALRVNAFAFLFVAIYFIVRRWRIARARAIAAAPPELPEPTP